MLPPEAAPRQEAAIELLLPDRFVGRELTLQVDGLVNGQVSLTSTTSFRVVEGRSRETLILRRDEVVLRCGDGILSTGEACDDANEIADDGCSRCVVDQGWTCAEEPSVCTEIPPNCGNGALNPPEQCDDNNLEPGDGCSALCSIEMGWLCDGEPAVCTEIMTVCGDGMIDVDENCDDGNGNSGDGCGTNCQIDPGWGCIGEPSVCTEEVQLCPNGNVELGETCDDNNATEGDGCNSTCQEEPGWLCYGTPSACEQQGPAVFVDPVNCPFVGRDGTRVNPYCTLEEAAADPDARLVIMVEGLHQGKSELVGTDINITVVGDGRVVLGSADKDTLKVKTGAQVILRNLTVAGLGGSGGGIKVEMGGVLTIDRCTIGPSAELGVEVKDGDLTVLKSRFLNNAKGGAKLETGSHRFENTVFAQNGGAAAELGGLWFVKAGPASELLNVTIADNVSLADKPAGVRCDESLPIKNTIVWANQGEAGAGVGVYCDPTYSLFETAVLGEGNQVGEPIFVGADYHLDPAVNGPGVDSGSLVGAPFQDIDDEPRPQGAGVDMGADEAR